MTEHIKINGVTPRIRYVGNGTNCAFEVPFAIFENTDLKVYIGDTLQSSSNYTLSSNAPFESGTLTFNSAPSNGSIITLQRSLDIKRTSDFQEGSTLRAEILNDELDYQTACLQEVVDNINRSMVLPPYAIGNDINLTLPTPSAGKAIVWNAQGTNLENSTVSVNAMESTLNGYKTAAETAASTATTKASEATSQAQTAATQAQTAAAQATIATQKAQEATTTLSSKAGINMDNVSAVGKKQIVSFGRVFTNTGRLVAQGTSTIAGTYDLGFTDENVKIGVFVLHLQLTQSGGSSMGIGSDVVTTTQCISSNNSFQADACVTIPFKKTISINFPTTSGGISQWSSCYFVGYM